MDVVPIIVLVHGLHLMPGECGDSLDVREALVDMDLLNHLPQGLSILVTVSQHPFHRLPYLSLVLGEQRISPYVHVTARTTILDGPRVVIRGAEGTSRRKDVQGWRTQILDVCIDSCP